MGKRYFSLLVAGFCLLVFMQLGFVQTATAQQNPPLNFGNNFFVTGDYVVAGATGMTTNFTTINSTTYAVGTINIPDANPGIQGTKQVPKGAQVVAALLYWQTVEKVGVTPGGPGSGQNGYFRPVKVNGSSISGGPAAPGYAMNGLNLTGAQTVSWSNGGCSGTSTGKALVTYRADVRAALPQDSTGNILANNVTFEVRLPSNTNNTPITLGATLVLIYRVVSPDVPLSSIVIYDGDYAPTSSSSSMSLTIQGFYDTYTSAANSVTRVTHIVGSGQSNKYENVYFGSPNNPTLLPSLYGSQPPFPGYYGEWDNPTWTLTKTSKTPNPLPDDASSAVAQVSAASSNPGCVSWGAIIVGTTVKNSDNDGILDSWKTNQGYCDASVPACAKKGDNGWVDLTGAAPHQKDVFLQMDWMCSTVYSDGSCSGDSYNPYTLIDPHDHNSAVQKLVAAYQNNGITVHLMGRALPAFPGQVNGNIIQEPPCTDDTSVNPPSLCAYPTGPTAPGFPNPLGVVAWKSGLIYLKNQFIDPSTGVICNSPNGSCVAPVFQHGKKDSYHYVLFAHGLGLPNWSLLSGLSSVAQTGTTVKFTTSSSVSRLNGLAGDPNFLGDATCSQGRVTVAFAVSNPHLNGTYCVQSVNQPSGATPGSFTINLPTSAGALPKYTFATDPNLSVASGQAGTISGESDVGGQDSVITLGLWKPSDVTWQTTSGTFMHEFGHTMGLTHGGFYFDALSTTNKNYTPTPEANCKPNFQSVMSYLFQVDLLDSGTVDASGNPIAYVDYSNQPLPTLTKSSGGNLGKTAYSYPQTNWFLNALSTDLGATTHRCDGSSNPNGTYMKANGQAPTSAFSFSAGQDINFDGKTSETLRGHNDWSTTYKVVNGSQVVLAPGVDLRQIGATGSISASGVGGLGGGSGVGGLGGGSGVGGLGGGSGVGGLGGGSGVGGLGGGSGVGGLGGGSGLGEITHDIASSYSRPPRYLAASEEISPRYIDLSWTAPTFGTVDHYNIYRTTVGQNFTTKVDAQCYPSSITAPCGVSGNSFTYQDQYASCNSAGYQYEVTAVVISAGQQLESVPSNVAPSGAPLLTGCYTNSAPVVPPSTSSPTPITLTDLATFTTSGAPTASAIKGDTVNVTWSLRDDDTGTYVAAQNSPNLAASTLTIIGPIPGDSTCSNTPQPPLYTGQQNYPYGHATLSPITVNPANTKQFLVSWNTARFNGGAGCYFFQIVTDSGQNELTTSPFTLYIYVSDTGPYVTTTTLPKAIAGVPYSNTIQQAGGVGQTFTWTVVSGTTPPGIALSSSGDPNTGAGTLSGTATDVGTYNFTVKVTDSNGNYGTQALSILVVAPVAQVNQPLSPETLLLGGAAPTLTVNGEGFFAGSKVWWNGTALTTTFVSTNQLTATLPAGAEAILGTASISVANKNSPNSNVGFFQVSDPIPAIALSRTDTSAGTVGTSPKAVIAADFNGDGMLDLAVVNTGAGTVSILLGNGHGTFTLKATLNAGGGPNSLAVGDFNKDGYLDLAVTNGTGNTVSVFLGNGDGTFSPGVQYPVGNGPVSVIAADFDRDGKLDLAVANQTVVSILLGNGDGTFQPYLYYPAGTTDVGSMAVGDFNGDNKLDLAVTNPTDGTVSVLLGNGDGTFQSPVPYPTANPLDHPTAVAALDVNQLDVNNNGKLDLVVTNLNGTVAILIGNGDGTFKPAVPYPTSTGASGPSGITSGDFNADGNIDLAITNQSANTVAILLGDGHGTFQAPQETTTGNSPAAVAAGDFKGNGRLDLAVANSTGNTVSIMLSRPQAPTGPASGTVTASSVQLNWTTSVSTTVTSYNIYRSTTSGTYTGAPVGSVQGRNTTTFTDSTTASGTQYYYVVTAVDPGNLESVNSNEISVITPPLPPTGVTPGATTPTTVALSWVPSITTSVTGYNVYRGATLGSETLKVNSMLVNGTSFTDTSVVPGTTYYYVVKAFGLGSLESVASNEVSVIVPIFVSDTQPSPPFNNPTTSLPDATVGASYTNTLYQDGAVLPVTWSISGPLPPGVTLNTNTGVLSGIPTAGGVFNFTATVTDSTNNTGTQALSLRVLRDVIAVDGSPSAPSGTLLRITPGATATTSTLASISNGQPGAVAMDRTSGNIYVAVTGATPRIAMVNSLGVATDPFIAGTTTGGVLASPVALAVDGSGNLYVGDNSLHAVYEFDSTGAQVGAATALPSSTTLNEIRMTFDNAGNLIVASDNISGSGVVEVDSIASGVLSLIYNSNTKQGAAGSPVIASVGGVAVLADGSIAVADSLNHAIYKITGPGTGSMAVTTAIAATNALCCNITGMTNPPSAANTTLYVTLSGANNNTPQLVLAVPELGTVSTLLSGTPLSFPNDVAWFKAQATYYVDGSGNFGVLDLIKGSTSVIGSGTVPNSTGIDLTPAGQVYVLSFNAQSNQYQLMQMNTTTGAATPVGTGTAATIPAADFVTTGGLTNGSYFAVDATSPNLYSIDLTTGATGLVGATTGLQAIPPNCGAHTSLAGSGTMLYYTIGWGTRRNATTPCASPMADMLYTIDPQTGIATTVGQVSVNGFVGSAYVGGRLYGFTGNGNEYAIDVTNGNATLVVNTNTLVFGGASTTSGIF